ncbi:c-type cytochrome [Candidatus Venteria ishoeyi]|uniref:Cytochrome c-551 n=1 Tax=Candidatus Venteria ishoeyi TaxID=1899563 RepID=A0A1H6FF23_9GAMM|nr:c-type cytochrome [Candidatus Venteria ishoeyi]MDM8545475.1 c-type cytochrome [Candidatus Venteria ishoeyi]SEH07949.1 Cytochrome c-552 precursor [Candidatus Venteria ishoeyi]
MKYFSKVMFSSIAGFSMLAVSALAQAEDGVELARKNSCLACHSIDNKIVGPAYKEIANKYKGADEAMIQQLRDKVKNGGSGTWGNIPMPPNATVSDENINILVSWVLSLAD